MSIKITQIFDERRDQTILRVEGKLYLIDAKLLEQTLRELQAEGLKPVEINLSEVFFLNTESAAVLRRLRRLGAVLTDINYFVQKVIEQTESAVADEEADEEQ
jgi:anti-anti-sigma regulatory factor